MSAMPLQSISILGATGSIGRSTLDVVARHPGRFSVCAVAAGSNVEALARIAAQHGVRYAAIGDAGRASELRRRLREFGSRAEVLAGAEGLIGCATLPEADCVMAAIVGAAGLGATIAAARAGKKLLLANKEALVAAGPVFLAALHAGGGALLPIDSEHNAIFQCLPPGSRGNLGVRGIRRILLTGSGGPFRVRSRRELAQVTPAQACAHPTWTMGPKISVDSATMMNKGLEVIEAHWLFEAPPEAIQVVVHPQSVIHSMVEYLDGSVIAQLGNPDMRTPIAQALAYPERIEAGVGPLDLFRVGALEFKAPDFERFPALRLAYASLERGGSAPALLNAANEVAVSAFLARRIPFLEIERVIEATLQGAATGPIRSLEDVMEADRLGREHALRQVARLEAAPA
ncbi:MAG: 1-deoxy-D-xylulose-5-phosphate reductoisomerase [Burkholderiales bacterium]|nr:1-deoxy-D-xylulose-5-phosphate reductoisomerase [Burkholderiales bacterium]